VKTGEPEALSSAAHPCPRPRTQLAADQSASTPACPLADTPLPEPPDFASSSACVLRHSTCSHVRRAWPTVAGDNNLPVPGSSSFMRTRSAQGDRHLYRGVFECQLSVIQGFQGFGMQNARSWSPVQRLAGLGAHLVVLLAVLLELAPLLSLLSLVLAAVVGPVS